MATRRLKRRVSGDDSVIVSPETTEVYETPILHEITCSCGSNFPVFSLVRTEGREELKIDKKKVYQDRDVFQQTCVRCPDCESLHLVTEVCESGQYAQLPRGHELWEYNPSETPSELESLFDGYEVHPAKRAYFVWHLKNGREGGDINLINEIHPDGEIRGRRLQRSPEGKFVVIPFRARVFVDEIE